ncbi:MAG: class I SAM-dependent methyltransferase [Motiliproteus sp.]
MKVRSSHANRDLPQAVSSWRTTLARRSENLIRPAEHFLRFSELVREAFPIGLLRAAEIEQVVREAYRSHPDFYAPDDYHFRYEEQLLPLLKRHANGLSLLDLYCGHGREAAIFARAGFGVVGIDEDARSVEKAQGYLARSELDAEFATANVDHWQPAKVDWSIIYSSLWMYSCIPGRPARLHWLQRVSDWLQPQGIIVLSVTPRLFHRAARIRHFVARCVALLSLNQRSTELGDRFHSHLFWHDFTNDEVEEELSLAGLKLLDRLEIEGYAPCTFFIAKRNNRNGAN